MKEYLDIIKRIDLLVRTSETIYMVVVSTMISFSIGLLLGLLSVITDKRGLRPNLFLKRILDVIINIGRSVPFMIFMIVLTPFTRWIVGQSYGSTAVIIPLTIAAIPFVSRLVETTLKEIDQGMIESVITMGASLPQIVWKVYLVENLPTLVRNFSLTMITLVGYSAMAGVVGGGGLGHVAMAYGVHMFNFKVMMIALVVIVVLVQIIQFLFDLMAKKIDKRV